MRRTYTIIALASILGLCCLALFVSLRSHNPLAVLDHCFTKASPEDIPDIECLRREAKALVAEHSTTNIMNLFEAEETSATTKRNCHFISHFIGEFTLKQSRNIETALSQCTNACRFGCPHGAIGAFIVQEVGGNILDEDFVHENKDRLIDLGKKYCIQSNDMCHAVGHIFYISMETYDAALSACEQMPKRAQNCYAGALMEGAGHVDSLWIGTSTISAVQHTDDYTYPCLTLRPRFQNACFRYLPGYQHARFIANNVTDINEQVRISRYVCENAQGESREHCFYGLGNYAYRFVRAPGSTITVSRFCEALETERDRIACSIGVVRAFVTDERLQYKESVAYCDAITEDARRSTCLTAAFYMRDHIEESVIPPNLCKGVRLSNCESLNSKYQQEKEQLPNYFFGLK